MPTPLSQCGSVSYTILAIAGGATLIAILALVLGILRKEAAAVVSGFAILAAIAAAGAGVMGTLMGRTNVGRALVDADPTVVEELRRAGNEEAMSCTYVGGYAAAAPLLLGVVALVVGVKRRPRPAT